MSKGSRVDGLRIGDAVQGEFIGELGDGVEGSQKAVLLGAIGRIAPGARVFGLPSVGKGAGCLAVDDVGK